MTITPTQLRANLYYLLDQVLESGEPLEVIRKGKVLRIVPAEAPFSHLQKIVQRDCILGDPEELVHVDWSDPSI